MEKFNSSHQVTCNSLSTRDAQQELDSLGLTDNWEFFGRSLNLCSGRVREEMVRVRSLAKVIVAVQRGSFVWWLSIVRIGRGESKRGKLGLRS